MKDIGRLFFVAGAILFCAAALYWNSFTGVFLWRIGVGVSLLGIGLFVLWGDTENIWLDKRDRAESDRSRPNTISLLPVLSALQFLLVSFTLFLFFSIGNGLQFIAILVLVPILMFFAALWQFLNRFWDVLLVDQLIPFLFMGVFVVPSIELSSGLIIFARVSGALLVLLSMYAVFQNFINLKRISKGLEE
jgi:hypothetical protein